MPTRPNEELESRRIILLRVSRGRSPEILLGLEGTHHTLPQVQIVRWQRGAAQLTAAFKQMCGLDVVCVCSLEPRTLESGSEQIPYEVMEPHGPQDEETLSGNRWMAVDLLVENQFHDRRDFQAVRQAVALCVDVGEEPSRERFARLGWFEELRQWVDKEIAARGLHLSGRYSQLNASATFSLIRFETEGPAVWFKAVGVPNRREYPITVTLSRLFSSFLPEIIATRPEWDGWLALEAPGKLLSDCPSISLWESAARDLAELQIDSLGTSDQLLDSGARDLRTAALADLVEPFFQTMGDLMEQQTRMPPLQLTRARLHVLAAQVRDALDVLEETGIPEGLGHMDFNPGNIVCSPAGSVFLDWAEAFVGHPFLTVEYFREHLRRTFGEDNLQEAPLLVHYISPWRAHVSEEDLRRTLDVTPLVAAFAYAVGNDVWKESRKIQEPRTAGYLRSLTRRMEREAHVLAERSVSCPN